MSHSNAPPVATSFRSVPSTPDAPPIFRTPDAPPPDQSRRFWRAATPPTPDGRFAVMLKPDATRTSPKPGQKDGTPTPSAPPAEEKPKPLAPSVVPALLNWIEFGPPPGVAGAPAGVVQVPSARRKFVVPPPLGGTTPCFAAVNVGANASIVWTATS